MKLRNKTTDEIGYLISTNWNETSLIIMDKNGVQLGKYDSLAELNAEWEDYEEPKEFWFVDSGGEVKEATYLIDNDKSSLRSFGNYFETREEAEKALEKLKAWKRLKDNGFKIKGWKFTPDMKQIEGNYVKIEAEVPQILINEKDIDLLFGGEE